MKIDINSYEENDDKPMRLNIRSRQSDGSSYREGHNFPNRKYHKGRWIFRFIKSNEGRNYDTVYSDFLKKMEEKKISEKDKNDLMWTFKHYIFEDMSPYYRITPWTLDKQNRIVKDENSYYWKGWKGNKRSIETNREIVSMTYDNDYVTKNYPWLEFLIEKCYGRRTMDYIKETSVPFGQWKKLFYGNLSNLFNDLILTHQADKLYDKINGYLRQHETKKFDVYSLRKEIKNGDKTAWNGVWKINYDKEERVVNKNDDTYKQYKAETEKKVRKKKRDINKKQSKMNKDLNINELTKQHENDTEN